MKTFGYFGGTFDPIHLGHLRMALEVKESLDFDELSLLPCRQPPHKHSTHCDDVTRAYMVELAIKECPNLSLDRRELDRDTLSYSYDTIKELREELGPDVSLCWCVGMDSLVNISSWYRWRELLDLCHLVVVTRPGWELPCEGEVYEWLKAHQTDAAQLKKTPFGCVVVQALNLLDVSATDIRQRVASGNSVQFMLPDAVWHYIEQNQLYR